MATATAVSIGTSNKVSVDYQSQEVSVNVTFELERSDTDLLAFVTEKAAEVERAHSTIWRRIRELRAEAKAQEAAAATAPSDGKAAQTAEPPADSETRQPAASVRRGRNGKGHSPSPPPAEPSAQDAPASGNGNGHTAKDEVDPFADDPSPATPAAATAPTEEMSSVPQQRAILSLAGRARMSEQTFLDLLNGRFGKRLVEQLTRREAAQLLVELQRRDRVPAAQAA